MISKKVIEAVTAQPVCAKARKRVYVVHINPIQSLATIAVTTSSPVASSRGSPGLLVGFLNRNARPRDTRCRVPACALTIKSTRLSPWAGRRGTGHTAPRRLFSAASARRTERRHATRGRRPAPQILLTSRRAITSAGATSAASMPRDAPRSSPRVVVPMARTAAQHAAEMRGSSAAHPSIPLM